MKKITLETGECIISYDVTALFTSVPVEPVIQIIMNKLEWDTVLQQRTIMTLHHIIQLLELCLNNTCPIPGLVL